MDASPYKLLNQLVAAALTVFVAVIVLLVALVIRQIYLQQQIAELSVDLQVNVDELAEITDEIQSELVAEQTAGAASPPADSEAEINELLENLEDLDQQLDSLEQDINQVTQVLEAEAETTPGADPATQSQGNREQGTVPPQVNHLFTLIAAVIGVASVVIAVLLGMALRIQQSISRG